MCYAACALNCRRHRKRFRDDPSVKQSELPTGSVTFFFSDIEGSTKLLQALGEERYAAVLAEHRLIMRAALEAQGGVEVGTEGDSFFVAFPTASGAVEAARAITARLAEGQAKARIGLHTGTPLRTAEGYVGEEVHRAARVAAAGHGGQVLVSAATAALVGTDGLRDLGEHRLKDFDQPVAIFQLGDERFPATQDNLEHEPPTSSQLVRGPRRRGRRGGRPCCATALAC